MNIKGINLCTIESVINKKMLELPRYSQNVIC